MRKKYKVGVILFTVGLLMGSCYDKDDKITFYSDITISNIALSGRITKGDILDLKPEALYEGEPGDYTYVWFKNSDSTNAQGESIYFLEKIYEGQHLQYLAEEFGPLNLRLEVQNNVTGNFFVQILNYTVVSRAERGWYLLKETESGNTDIDIYWDSDERILDMPDVFATAYGEPIPGKPVSMFYNNENYYQFNPDGEYRAQQAIFLMSEKEIYAWRTNDEVLIAKTEDLFYEMPGDQGFSSLFSDVVMTTIINSKGKASWMVPQSSRFMPEVEGSYELAPYIVKGKNYLLNHLVYDKKNSSFGFLRPKDMSVNYFPDAFLPDKGNVPGLQISSNNMDANLLFMGQCAGNLDTLDNWNDGIAYALMQKQGDSENLILFGLNLFETRYGSVNIGGRYGPFRWAPSHSPIRSSETIRIVDCPEFASADFYTLRQEGNIIYFIKDNKLGYYNIANKSFKKDLYTFPAGEEVTFFKFIDNQYDSGVFWDELGEHKFDHTFTRLVVATYKSGKYKTYSFKEYLGDLELTTDSIEGEGKVKRIMWITPTWQLPYYGNYIYT